MITYIFRGITGGEADDLQRDLTTILTCKKCKCRCEAAKSANSDKTLLSVTATSSETTTQVLKVYIIVRIIIVSYNGIDSAVVSVCLTLRVDSPTELVDSPSLALSPILSL